MRISVLAASICLAIVGLSAATESQAVARKPTSIAAQGLGPALQLLAQHHGFQIVYVSEEVNDLRTQGATGNLTRDEALNAVLSGTGMTFRYVDENTVTVFLLSLANSLGTSASGSDSLPQASNSFDSPGGALPRTKKLLSDRVLIAQVDEKPTSKETDKDQQTAKITEKPTLFEGVVVTGTHIRGVYPQSSPLSIYTEEEIRSSGVTTIEQFIEKLPQNHGTTFSSAPFSTAGAGTNPESATGIDLRGLGIGTTLVLLNGRRLALAAYGQTVDISMIPLGALERIEVLTDGASGIYGSDAVGGVVNLVLKDNFEGAQTSLGYGSVTDGGLQEMLFEQTFGHRWGSGRGVLSYQYLDRTDLDASERDFAASAAPYTLAPPDRRHSIFLSGRQDGPAGIELFGDALFSSRDTRSLTTHSALDATARTATDETQYFTDLGARGVLGGSIGGEIVASYAVLKSEFQSDETSIFGDFRQSSDFEHSVFDVTGKLDGDMFELPGGMLRFSAGGGHTEERFVNKGVFNGQAGAPLRIERTTNYLFAELFAPLLSPESDVMLAERLELSLAARYTDYSDFGSETSPRIGLSWAPASFLNVRATYSESFRAPSLIQLNPLGSLNVIFAPAAFGFPDPWSTDGSTMLLFAQGVSSTGLDPERAKTYTAGFDLRPQGTPDLKLSATYFKIDYEGRILVPFVFAEPFLSPQNFSDIIYLDPDADLIGSVIDGSTNTFNMTNVDPTDSAALATVIDVILDGRRRNLAVSKLDGIDFLLDYRGQRPFGALSLGGQLTYLLNFDQQITTHAPVLSVVDTVLHPADLKGRVYIGLARGIWNGQLNVNYVDNYENPFGDGPTKVSSWTTVDLNVTWDLGRNSDGALGGTQLSVSVQNLLDSDPPFVAVGTTGSTLLDPVGYDPTNANPIGRFIALRVSKAW